MTSIESLELVEETVKYIKHVELLLRVAVKEKNALVV